MLVALVLPKLLERASDRRVMLTAATAMAAALVATAVLWVMAPERIGWSTLIPAWVVLGMSYAGLVTPGGRLLRRSAQSTDLPQLFAAQFSLSHVCWLLAYPLAGWLGAQLGLGVALAALSALATLGLIAAARAWPKNDPTVVPHDHPELPADHPHWREHGKDAGGAHAHTYQIDELHRRWPG